MHSVALEYLVFGGIWASILILSQSPVDPMTWVKDLGPSAAVITAILLFLRYMSEKDKAMKETMADKDKAMQASLIEIGDRLEKVQASSEKQIDRIATDFSKAARDMQSETRAVVDRNIEVIQQAVTVVAELKAEVRELRQEVVRKIPFDQTAIESQRGLPKPPS